MIAIPSFVPSYAALRYNHIHLPYSPCMFQKYKLISSIILTSGCTPLGASPRKPEEGFCVRRALHPFDTIFHISLINDNDQFYNAAHLFSSRCQKHARRVYLQLLCLMLLIHQENLTNPKMKLRTSS